MTNENFDDPTDERAVPWNNQIGDTLKGKLENFDVIQNSMKDNKDQLVLHIRDEAGKLWAFYTNVDAERTFKKGFHSGLYEFGKLFAVKRMEDVPMKDGRNPMKHYAFWPRATADDAQARAKAVFSSEQPKARGKVAQPVESRAVVNPEDGFSDDIPF